MSGGLNAAAHSRDDNGVVLPSRQKMLEAWHLMHRQQQNPALYNPPTRTFLANEVGIVESEKAWKGNWK